MTGTRYELTQEPVGRDYDAFLDALSRFAGSFSLVVSRLSLKNAPVTSVISELKPFLVLERETDSWPGTELLAPRTATLYTFRSQAGAIETLKRRARRLYAWQGPELPDDPCFYRSDGSTMIATTSHERDCLLFLTEVEMGVLRELVPSIDVARVQAN